MASVKNKIEVNVYSREWLDENEYELTDELFRKFDLLNERDWNNAEEVAIAYSEKEIIGVIIGYFNTCLICQVDEEHRRQGVGTELVKATGFLFPKQNGAPEFWEAIENNDSAIYQKEGEPTVICGYCEGDLDFEIK